MVAIKTIVILSAISYIASLYLDQTVANFAGKIRVEAKDLLENPKNIFSPPKWKEFGEHPITKDTVYYKHENSHVFDYIFVFAGLSACASILIGDFMNIKFVLLIGSVGKLIVDIIWPVVIISEVYTTSCFGFYKVEELTDTNQIMVLWIFHFGIKIICAIVIFISFLKKKQT